MAKNWFNFPIQQGETTRQAHADFPEGTYEREMGAEGFFGPVSHLYHTHPPTNWLDIDGPLKPRAYDTNKLQQQTAGQCPWAERQMLLSNNHCEIAFWSLDTDMTHLVRDADGDHILFIHEGDGDLFCDFGHMSYRDGDYILLPRGTMWRLSPKSATKIMMIGTINGHFKTPDRGLLGPTALYDPAILDHPEMNDAFYAQQDENEWIIHVKRTNEITKITYPFNPLDAKGWKGDLCPIKLNWRDIRPVISHSYHIPPSAHTTFVADRFVICTFVPRPMESAKGALKLPFYHSNDDYDEFLFYHRGEFMSRDNIHPGMTTFHPAGFIHGPHPKAFAKAEANAGKMGDEVAVMIDTRDPLNIHDQAEEVEDKNYVHSWK